METWWASLSEFDKVIWIITIPASIIFIIQMILTFMGMDSSGDIDVSSSDVDGAEQPFQLFTFRNFINFLLGFGWTSIALKSAIGSKFILVLLSTLSGILLVFLVMYIFYSLSKLQQSGNMEIKNAVNQIAEVYLTIPAFKGGAGKIHVKIQGGIREVDAITNGERILTGQRVKVINIINNNLLLVEPV